MTKEYLYDVIESIREHEPVKSVKINGAEWLGIMKSHGMTGTAFDLDGVIVMGSMFVEPGKVEVVEG